MEKHMTNKRTGISYTLIGDYYFPDLILLETTDYTIGRFGRERLQYLKGHQKALYTQLLLHGELNTHLHEIDVQAQEMYDLLVRQYAAVQGIDEAFKATNQMEWVGRMNNIRNAVMEIINADLLTN